MTRNVGADWRRHADLVQLVKSIDRVYRCKDRRTAGKRFEKVLREKDAAVRRHPEVTPLFPLLEARFPLVVNAVGSSLLPSTNNATERVIKAFHRHYRDMAGLESLETAEIHAKLFRFWYRLTPMRDAVDKNDRNKCPLEKADFDLDGVPIIEYVRQVLCTAKRVAPASQRAAALDERRTTDPGRLAAVG